MKRIGWAVMAAWVASGSAAPPSQAQDAVPIKIEKAAEITALFLEKTVYGRYPDGSSWIEFHTKDGVSAYRISEFSCPSRWEVSGNTLCSSTEPFEPACFNVWRSGSKLLLVPAGEDPKHKDVLEVDRMVDGDPLGLLADSEVCPE